MRYSQRRSLRSLTPRVTEWDLAWECCKGLRCVFIIAFGLYEFSCICLNYFFGNSRQDQTNYHNFEGAVQVLLQLLASHATSDCAGDSSLRRNALFFG